MEPQRADADDKPDSGNAKEHDGAPAGELIECR